MTSNLKKEEAGARRYLTKELESQEVESIRGRLIVFDYPKSNHENVYLRYKERVFRVDVKNCARDFGTDPNDEPAAERDPHLRRMGKLISGFDLTDGIQKQYYHGAMQNIRILEDNEAVTVEASAVAISDASGVRVATVDLDAKGCAQFVRGFNRRVKKKLGIATIHPIRAAIVIARSKSRFA